MFTLRAWGSIEDFEGVELHGQICVGPACGMLHTKREMLGSGKPWGSYQSMETPGQKEKKRPESMEES